MGTVPRRDPDQKRWARSREMKNPRPVYVDQHRMPALELLHPNVERRQVVWQPTPVWSTYAQRMFPEGDCHTSTVRAEASSVPAPASARGRV